MKSNVVYIRHILDAINRIQQYTGKSTYDDFSQNDMMTAAVVRELEIVGEAAGQVSVDFQKKNPHIPWREMISTRNKMIHDYFGVNIEIVWEIVQKELPRLQKELIEFT